MCAKLGPKHLTGVDISRLAIRLCNSRHTLPNLHFVQGDAERAHEIPSLLQDFRSAGLTLLSQEDIAPGVVRAMELDEERKIDIMERITPRVLHGAFREFSGARGTEKYDAFRSGRYQYLVCALRKDL